MGVCVRVRVDGWATGVGRVPITLFGGRVMLGRSYRDCWGGSWEVVAVVHPGGPDVLMLVREDGAMGWGRVDGNGQAVLERVG